MNRSEGSRKAGRAVTGAGKRTYVIAVAGALLVSAATRGWATTWEGVTSDLDKLAVYVDKSHIVRNGDIASAWLLFDFRHAQIMPNGIEQYRSVTQKVAVSCADRTYAREKEIKYSGAHASGEVVDTYTWPPAARRFKRAVAFTNSRAVVNFVCRAPSVRVGQAVGQGANARHGNGARSIAARE